MIKCFTMMMLSWNMTLTDAQTQAIEDVARWDNIDLMTIATIESLFIPDAESHKNAYGVFQITPIAEKEVELYLKQDYDRKKYFDNLIIGKTYWDILLARYGNTEDALIAYNAGHKWLMRYKREGVLPKETIEYLKRFNRVKGNCDEVER